MSGELTVAPDQYLQSPRTDFLIGKKTETLPEVASMAATINKFVIGEIGRWAKEHPRYEYEETAKKKMTSMGKEEITKALAAFNDLDPYSLKAICGENAFSSLFRLASSVELIKKGVRTTGWTSYEIDDFDSRSALAMKLTFRMFQACTWLKNYQKELPETFALLYKLIGCVLEKRYEAGSLKDELLSGKEEKKLTELEADAAFWKLRRKLPERQEGKVIVTGFEGIFEEGNDTIRQVIELIFGGNIPAGVVKKVEFLEGRLPWGGGAPYLMEYDPLNDTVKVYDFRLMKREAGRLWTKKKFLKNLFGFLAHETCGHGTSPRGTDFGIPHTEQQQLLEEYLEIEYQEREPASSLLLPRTKSPKKGCVVEMPTVWTTAIVKEESAAEAMRVFLTDPDSLASECPQRMEFCRHWLKRICPGVDWSNEAIKDRQREAQGFLNSLFK